jgi:hypothetical protein
MIKPTQGKFGKIQLAMLLGLFLTALKAEAAMGNLGTNYGVLPSDVASAQALSLFNSQVSAVYYNPAYLTRDPRGELTVGALYGNNNLTAKNDGGAAPLITNGSVLQSDSSRQVLLGMKTNLSSLTKSAHPLYFALMLGAENNGQELMSFNSKTSNQGQFFNYGREPLFLNLGGGTELMSGISAGFSARVTLHSDATLSAQSDLAGNTQHEDLNVAAKPVLRPIFGISADWGRALCGNDKCWYNGLETAFAFRGYSNTRTKVSANDVIPGTVPSPGLTLAINTYDAYQPNIYTAGVLYNFDRYRIGVTGEFQQWSRLGQELAGDTIKDQANLSFRDIWIPRLGFDARVDDTWTLTSGVAYEPSALVSSQSLDVNYLDNDRVVLGLGATANIRDPWIFAFPVRLDIAYEYQMMRDRDFQLTSSSAPANPYETVTAGGRVQVLTASLSLKF